jgi:hypothetical protein
MKLVVVSLLAFIALGCVDPKDRRPGLRLSGEVITDPIDDWSFTDRHAEIFIETRTRYIVPHSVTIVCASVDGRLYIGARRPTAKRWVANVGHDPNVRLKIGDKMYPRRLERVEDPTEQEIVYEAYARKYDWEIVSPNERPELWYFRVLPSG